MVLAIKKKPVWERDDIVWENNLESIPGIERISEDNFSMLRQLLAPCEDADSYLTSPVYYAFTGRNGLWLYKKDRAFVLLCWHPNISGQILIFPQLTGHETDLVSEMMSDIPLTPNGVRIARAKPNEAINYKAKFSNRRISYIRREETVLDWKYPIHILSTEALTMRMGPLYKRLRYASKLKNFSTKILPFDAKMYSKSAEKLLHNWTAHNSSNHEQYENLYAPFESLFSWSLEQSSGLSGLMIFIDDEMQAISLWDVSNGECKTANLYVNLCNPGIYGLSEFTMLKCCEALSSEGIRFLNLGGSETEGLDTFKRKFRPMLSLDLCSIDVEVEDTIVNIEDMDQLLRA